MIPRAHIRSAAKPGTLAFAAFQRGRQGAGDGGGEFVLHREDIDQVAIVAIGPDMAAGRRVDQLRGQADASAGFADAAFQNVADTQFAAGLNHIDMTALINKGRVAGDHEHPAEFRQRGDQILGHAVGEIFLLGIAAQIGERQDRDGGLVRQGEAIRRRRPRRVRPALDDRIGDEAHALARHGPDRPLRRAAVAHRLARQFHGRIDRPVGNNPAAPDMLDQFVAADDTLAVFKQIHQQVEHLRLDDHRRAVAMQLAARQIECVAGEPVSHSISAWPARTAASPARGRTKRGQK